MKKKILILGGSDFQIPLIKSAKQADLFVITCDYLPDNPGHKLSDKYINVSTTDKSAILQIAIDNKIDAVTTFSSDPAIPTVAFVTEKLGLPGPSIFAADSFTNKNLFRKLLTKARLNVPDFYITESEAIPEGVDESKRYIVKPVDSSGSKGVRLSDGTSQNTQDCIRYALSFSRSKKCIIEEYIDGPQVHGDAYLQNGEIIASYMGDHYFYTATNSFVPTSTRWPSKISEILLEDLKVQLESLSVISGYLNGAINVEARVSNDNKIYIIEVGARNGGNFVPLIQERLTGFNYVEAVLNNSIGKQVQTNTTNKKGIGAYYIIHAETNGVFECVNIAPSLKSFVYYQQNFKKQGDEVEQYCGSHTTIGILLLEFPSIEIRDSYMDNISNLVSVLVE